MPRTKQQIKLFNSHLKKVCRLKTNETLFVCGILIIDKY